MFESWRSPITPSATVAESKDSIAPRIAIVIAGDTNPLITFHEIEGISASGNWFEIENLSPIVSTLSTPAYCLSSSTATVITMMAIRLPGSFFNTLLYLAIIGHAAITATEPIPTPALHRSMVPNEPIYATHFSIKSLGTVSIVSPNRSLICVVKMVSAIPLVNPTTMGYGIYLIIVPKCSTPNIIRNTPAISVAIVSPSNPYC